MSHFSQATSRILSKGRAGLLGRRLFRQFHRFHITKIRSSESLSLVKTNSIMSVKEMLLLRASWFHMGVQRQRVSSSGHPYNACTISSLCYLQASHKSSTNILRLTKFALVGMESLQAHQTKCFTFPSSIFFSTTASWVQSWTVLVVASIAHLVRTCI